ncbi:FIST N-terminal domain-containing protein [Thalassococcus sp. S3]|uniref:FIST N-terminal domain-containing protein n=1 Tax=Thalassococcus sp. S3 TaxID=2017482 RepID=UPI00102409E7|nr:FIST N-terminal domain-containing protein [Thalassococcus sp. S3]QBF30604.1 GfdT protein [Thalassococcus sp. S3]
MNLVSALTRSQTIVRTASAPYDEGDPVALLADRLNVDDLELVLLFVTPEADAKAVIAKAQKAFAPVRVVGCTTAGELTSEGYSDGQVVAVGLPQSHFRARTLLVSDLDNFDGQAVIDQMIRTRTDLIREVPEWESEFTFLLIDGLSTREDALTSEIAIGLGPMPLFGGSAGDGTDFNQTVVFYDGQALENAAVLTQIRTRCPIKVVKTDNLVPTGRRMVVTGADPASRTVHEINAEPAAREYARLLGKDPNQLSTFTFAAHPVVVRIGDAHHVRSIQRVADNGDLVFFSAIDEGVVLTLAEPQNMVDHLRGELQALSAARAPDVILACDCLLRRIEAEQKQMSREISNLLSQNRVVGFSTYGEQLNSMHVNQTLTGVAIYPPDGE